MKEKLEYLLKQFIIRYDRFDFIFFILHTKIQITLTLFKRKSNFMLYSYHEENN